MRILLVCHNITGVEYHRLVTPHSKMGDVSSIASIDHLSDSFFYDFDLIVSSSVISKMGNQELLWKQLKRVGIPVIIDRDDTWVLPHNHPMYREWTLKQRAKDIIYNLKQADLVTTTTSYLANLIKVYNSKVEVLPNAIDFTQSQFIPNPDIAAMKSNLVHIGWSGSVTHLQDLQMIEGDLLSLNKGVEKDYKLMLAGFHEGDYTWNNYEKIFTSEFIIGDDNYGRINSSDVNSYAQAYNLMDVGLIPLKDTEFNRAKSNLKMLEMGAFGLPVIVSDVEPYRDFSKHGKNCLVVGKREWYKAIRKLIENPELRKDLGSQLKADVIEFRNEVFWREVRTQVYKNLIKAKKYI
jgi:glycosyltransferase involved in cell wall biosynthesis